MIEQKKVFLDTNILVYAYDKDAANKREIALSLIRELWNRQIMPSISVQVLQELYVNLLSKGIRTGDIHDIIEEFLFWNVVENTILVFRNAMKHQAQFQISFWDAMIVSAAEHAGADVIYSEDLSHGQNYGSVMVINPFI